MPLPIGHSLGSYQIVGPLGKGGMGEVYRAKDTKLGRDVAIKVLPTAFALHSERLARFEREAKVLASLNHPNIATIYAVEESPAGKALVMELVEGDTLKGPVDLETALKYAAQIASALEAAHEKGITHRDLKPANIMLTRDGVIKVLDFGLAAVTQPSGDSEDAATAATLTMSPTQAGTILGTAPYMSPEQASGRPVDKRTDIWAFGVVLFEVLTGKRLFGGDTIAHTLASVLKDGPDWTQVPARVRRLLQACLAKDVKQRLQSIADWRYLLTEEAAAVPQVIAPASKLPWIIAAAFAAAAAVALVLWAPWRSEPLKPLVRLEVDLGADVALPADAGQDSVILSPDGTRLVYFASVAGAPSRLYTRRLDQTKAAELPGTQGGQTPFFSPDSQWIGFAVANKYNKISVEGGAVVPLTDGLITGAGAWGEDGSILLPGILNNGMRLLPPSGGQAAKLTDVGNGEIAHVNPQFLPGGKFALFSVYQQAVNVDTVTIEAISPSDAKRKVVRRGGTSPHYVPSGHLLYVNKSTLFAIPFDAEKLETSGNAIPILDDVKFNPNSGNADLSLSRNGTLVYRKGGAGGSNQMTMQWIDAAGKRSPLLAKPGVYNSPHLSPDAKRLAVAVTEGGSQDIWVYDPQRDQMSKLTFGGGFFSNPVWSPDGRFVLFTKAGGGIFWTRSDGSGQPQLLVESKGILVPWSMSPDGKRLAFFEVGSAGGWIYTVEVTEDGGALKAGKPQRFFESKFTDLFPEFSPDGRWIAYATDESGRQEVIVRAFPAPASGQGGKWQVSSGGGGVVWWSRNSRELLYQEGDRVMAVSYTVNGDSFVADKPRVRIEKLGGPQWHVAPDGRIAVLTPVETAQAPAADHTVVFLENFFDELRRRVPNGK